jgi:hypothetical protein
MDYMARTTKTLIKFYEDPPFSIFSDIGFCATFADYNSAGLALESLKREILGTEMSNAVGRIVEVVAQDYNKLTGVRGTKCDVRCTTENGYIIIFEMQFHRDETILLRNDLETSQKVVEGTHEGLTHKELPKSVPIVICIDFLNYSVRDKNENGDYLQTAGQCWLKPPITPIDKYPTKFVIQISRFLESGMNFNVGLDCILFAMCEAHQQHKTLREVINMHAELQTYEQRDPGFRQMADRFDTVVSSPDVRQAYGRWFINALRDEGMLSAARNDGIAEERERWEDEREHIFDELERLSPDIARQLRERL